MDTFSNQRFPQKKDVAYAFLLTVVLFHIWAILVYLYRVPGLILHLTLGEVIVIGNYILVFELAECIIATLIFIILAIILSTNKFPSEFLHRVTFLIIFSFIWFIIFQSLDNAANTLQLALSKIVLNKPSQNPYLLWITSYDYASTVVTAIWIMWYISIIGLLPRINHFHTRLNKVLDLIISKIDLLAYLFLLVDAISLIVVIFRNI